MWSQVVEMAQPPPPRGGPTCFLRSDSLEALVIYDIGQPGLSVVQTFTFAGGLWQIEIDEAQFVMNDD